MIVSRTLKQLRARYAHEGQSTSVLGMDTDHEELIELPAGAVTLLDILGTMASRQGVTLISEDAELTIVQAAVILHVSRLFLIKLSGSRENLLPQGR